MSDRPPSCGNCANYDSAFIGAATGDCGHPDMENLRVRGFQIRAIYPVLGHGCEGYKPNQHRES